MNEFIAFVIHNWMLSSMFVALLIAVMVVEVATKSATGDSVSPEELTRLINRSKGVVVDIRDEESFKAGHVIGAIHFPKEDLAERVKKLRKHKNSPCIVVDADGRGFTDALKQLQADGFETVFGLSGGISAWKKAGMPLALNEGANDG